MYTLFDITLSEINLFQTRDLPKNINKYTFLSTYLMYI